MAKTFEVDRVGGGTFELVKDAATGEYSVKKVGFEPIKSLTIPDYTAGTTDAATDTSKAVTETSKKTTQEQTTEVFKQSGRDDTIDYTGQMLKDNSQMLKDAKSIDPQINARRLMTQDAAYTDQQKPPMLGDTGGSMDQMSGATTYQDAIMRGGVGVKAAEKRGPGIFTDKKPLGSPFKAFDASVKSGVISRPEYTSTTPEARAAMTSDAAQLGISKVESTQPTIGSFGTDPTSLVGGKDLEEDPGAQPRPDIEVEPTALKKVSTGLKSLSESVGRVVSSGPVAQIARAIGKPVGESAGVADFNKTYFNVRGGSTDGQRIAGNPATDLYAGMNRTSKFGNLEKAGAKRIATRERTIATKKNVSQKFRDDTERMKEQQREYQKAKEKKTSSARERARMNQSGAGGNDSGSSNARVICTDLHRTKELSTRDWIRDTKFTFKKLSIKHVKGYLLWAEPTVRHIQKYPRYRKIWKHIAQHRANDIAWRLNEGKFDLLGRIYAGIGEPLCWMLGNFVSDKQINRYNLSHWRRI